MVRIILGKISFIIIATSIIFGNQFVSFYQTVTLLEFLGISLVPFLSIILALLFRRRYLSLATTLKPNNLWGIMFLAISFIFIFLATYIENLYLLNSLALISFVISQLLLFFNSMFVKLYGIPISTIGLYLIAPMDTVIFSSIALSLLIISLIITTYSSLIIKLLSSSILILSSIITYFIFNNIMINLIIGIITLGLSIFLYLKTDKQINLSKCSDISGTHEGISFCYRCGRILSLPSVNISTREILIIGGTLILILITINIQLPFFTNYTERPTIWHSSIYSYDDKALFDPSGFLSSGRTFDSQYSSYLIEKEGTNATLTISVGVKSSIDKEFKDIQSDKIVAPLDSTVRSQVSKYKLTDVEGEVSSIAYWSLSSAFIFENGFRNQDLGFIIQTSGNSSDAINLLEETSSRIATNWSEAQRNTEDLWRLWIFYRRVSDFIPLIPIGIVLFSVSNRITRTDYEVERRTENVFNLKKYEQLLLATLASLSKRNGSASGIQVEKSFEKLSNTTQILDNVYHKLIWLKNKDIIDNIIVFDHIVPIINWKPKFPNS